MAVIWNKLIYVTKSDMKNVILDFFTKKLKIFYLLAAGCRSCHEMVYMRCCHV